MNRVGVDAIVARGGCLVGNAQLAKRLALGGAGNAAAFAIEPGWGVGGSFVGAHFSAAAYNADADVLAFLQNGGTKPVVKLGRTTHNFNPTHPAGGRHPVLSAVCRGAVVRNQLPAAARPAVTAVSEAMLPHGTLSTVPLNMSFVHSHLSPVAQIAAGVEIAGGAGTVPHFVNGAMLTAAQTAAEAPGATPDQQDLYAFYQIWRPASQILIAE